MNASQNSEYWKQCSIDHRHAGRYSAALLAIERYFEAYPNDTWAWFECASLLIYAGRLDDAEALLSGADPGSNEDWRFPFLSVRINLCKARGNTQEEEGWSRTLVQKMPGKSYGYVYLGCCLARQGKLADAENALRCGTECEGCPEEAYFNLASVLCALKRFTDAKTAIEQAVKIDPDYAAAIKRLEDIQACLQISAS